MGTAGRDLFIRRVLSGLSRIVDKALNDQQTITFQEKTLKHIKGLGTARKGAFVVLRWTSKHLTTGRQ